MALTIFKIRQCRVLSVKTCILVWDYRLKKPGTVYVYFYFIFMNLEFMQNSVNFVNEDDDKNY